MTAAAIASTRSNSIPRRLLMGGVVARGLHSRAWAQPAPGAQAARAAA